MQDQELHRGDHAVHDRGDVERPELTAGHAALQHATQQGVGGGEDLVHVELRQFGEGRGLVHEQHDQARGLGGAHPQPPGAGQLVQQLGAGAVVHVGEVARFHDDLGQVVAHHGLEELILAGVVEVERAFGGAGLARHVFDAGGRQALAQEQAQPGFQQFLGAGGLAPLARFAQRGRIGLAQTDGPSVTDRWVINVAGGLARGQSGSGACGMQTRE